MGWRRGRRAMCCRCRCERGCRVSGSRVSRQGEGVGWDVAMEGGRWWEGRWRWRTMGGRTMGGGARGACSAAWMYALVLKLPLAVVAWPAACLPASLPLGLGLGLDLGLDVGVDVALSACRSGTGLPGWLALFSAPGDAR